MTDDAGAAIRFDDGAAYELFMGRWSRIAGRRFLDWLAPPSGARWLEVGCGTGAFTSVLNERCLPAEIIAVDPATAQIAYASQRVCADYVAFYIGSVEALQWPDASFDFTVSALVLNFMVDRIAAMREMCRVTRPGGTIAGYVWDFASDQTPHGPLVRALRRMGIAAPAPPGGDNCGLETLRKLFADADLLHVETVTIAVEVSFPDFGEFWSAQRPSFSPTTRLIDSFTSIQRRQLMDVLHAELPVRKDGSIAYSAHANAVRGCVSK